MKSRNCNKAFPITPWTKTLDPPKENMNIDPPYYPEITKVINYMRSSPSPSPINQMRIIILKSYLLTRLCQLKP